MFDIFVLRPPSVTPMWVANVPDALTWMAKPKYKKRKLDMMIAVDEKHAEKVCSYACVLNSRNIITYSRTLGKYIDFEEENKSHYAWNSFYKDMTAYDIMHRSYDFDNAEERDWKAKKLIIVLAKVMADVFNSLASEGWAQAVRWLESIVSIDEGIYPRKIRLGVVNLSSSFSVFDKLMKMWIEMNPDYAPIPNANNLVKYRSIHWSREVYGIAKYRLMEVVWDMELTIGKKVFTKILKHHFPIEKFLEIV